MEALANQFDAPDVIGSEHEEVVDDFFNTDAGSNLTLLGLGLIKITNVSANFNNPRPSLTLDN